MRLAQLKRSKPCCLATLVMSALGLNTLAVAAPGDRAPVAPPRSVDQIAPSTPAAIPAQYHTPSPRAAAFVADAPQLPSGILLDRLLVRVDRLLADDEYSAALAVLHEIFTLQRQHDLLAPKEFHVTHAEVAFAGGRLIRPWDTSTFRLVNPPSIPIPTGLSGSTTPFGSIRSQFSTVGYSPNEPKWSNGISRKESK